MSNGEKQRYLVCKLTMCIIVFTIYQDVLCALLFKCGMPSRSLKLVFYIKEFIIILLGFFSIYNILKKHPRKLQKSEIYILLFGIIISVYLIIGTTNYGIYNSLLGSRQYIIPIMMLFIGEYVASGFNYKAIEKYIFSRLRKLSIFLVVTTFAERFLVPISFWQKINMVGFASAIKGQSGYYIDSQNTLIENFFNGGIRRALGVAGEPLLLSYYMIPIFFVEVSKSINSNKKKERITSFAIAVLVFLCQVLTLTRAIIVSEIAAIAVCSFIYVCIYVKIHINNRWWKYVAIAFCGIIVGRDFIAGMIYKTINNMDGGSAGMHLYQFRVGTKYITKYWYGLGIGTGSNAVSFSGMKNLTTEFAYANMTVDLGILGTLIYVLLAFYVIYKGIKNLYCGKNKTLSFLCSFSLMTLMITGFFSPQMWSMKSILLIWFIVGIFITYKSRNIVRIE